MPKYARKKEPRPDTEPGTISYVALLAFAEMDWRPILRQWHGGLLKSQWCEAERARCVANAKQPRSAARKVLADCWRDLDDGVYQFADAFLREVVIVETKDE